MINIEKWYNDIQSNLTCENQRLIEKYDLNSAHLYDMTFGLFNIVNDAKPYYDKKCSGVEVLYSYDDTNKYKRNFVFFANDARITSKPDIEQLLDLFYELHQDIYKIPGLKLKSNVVNTNDPNVKKIIIHDKESYYTLPYVHFVEIKKQILDEI